MDRGTRNLFALLLLVVVAITGGAALVLGGATTNDPEAPPGTTAVVGVIVGVDAVSLGEVRSFRLRAQDGAIMEFGLMALENGDEFPPGHLAEHQATAEPIWVWYRDAAGTLLAVRVEDAER